MNTEKHPKQIEQNIKDNTRLKILYYVLIGTAVGLFVYWICLVTHFDILGWNLGLILSPLSAGYVETHLARRYIKKTTGAISSFILFLVTVIYGFILSNPSLGLNPLTLIALIFILQSATPRTVNYILIRTTFIIFQCIHSIKDRIKESIDKKIHKTKGTPYVKIIELNKNDYTIKNNLPDINDLGIIFSTTNQISGKKIVEYKGIYESKNFLKYDQKEAIKYKDIEKKGSALLKDIEFVKNRTLSDLSKQLKKDNCNGILELNIQYDNIKIEKTYLIIQISIIGTGIVYED